MKYSLNHSILNWIIMSSTSDDDVISQVYLFHQMRDEVEREAVDCERNIYIVCSLIYTALNVIFILTFR